MVSACTGGGPGNDGEGARKPGDEMPDLPVQEGECRADGNLVRSPMRRLTVEEFDSAVEDLFGERTTKGFELLPSDEVTAGYANNAVITLQASHVEKFQLAARQIAELASKRADQLISCGGDREKCVGEFIDRVSKRAFSRPIESVEHELFLKIYKDKVAKTNHVEGIRLFVEILLQYPSFLYRPVVGETTAQEGISKLTKWEMASRLSFFLWGSVPDDELLDAASAGKLDLPSGIAAQVKRMMADPRFERTLRAFSLQWFHVGANLPIKNPEEFPDFDQALWSSLRDGMAKSFSRTVTTGGDLSAVLAGPSAYVDRRTAKIYGVQSDSDALEFVETNPAQRGGMMTQAGVMATMGNTEVSRPIKRGLFVRNRLFCQDPPPPPPEGVPPFEADTTNLTVRQMLEAHRTKPACKSCHAFFDSIGLAFSNFDGVGQYRESEKGQTIDASGVLDQTDVDGSFRNAMQMMNLIKGSKLVQACVATQVVRFAIGRLEEGGDKCSVEATVRNFESSGQSMAELFSSVALSNSFRFTGSK